MITCRETAPWRKTLFNRLWMRRFGLSEAVTALKGTHALHHLDIPDRVFVLTHTHLYTHTHAGAGWHSSSPVSRRRSADTIPWWCFMARHMSSRQTRLYYQQLAGAVCVCVCACVSGGVVSVSVQVEGGQRQTSPPRLTHTRPLASGGEKPLIGKGWNTLVHTHTPTHTHTRRQKRDPNRQMDVWLSTGEPKTRGLLADFRGLAGARQSWP